LAEKYAVEKIKTMGDEYMVAAGLPTPSTDHAWAVVDLALDMQTALARQVTPSGEPLQMRIGIHTGPVVAGVIGTKKFSYDLWWPALATINSGIRSALFATARMTPGCHSC